MLKDSLEAICGRPKRYEEMEIPFWDDEHISKQMLAAHLAPDFEGASRKLDFIRQSVDWKAKRPPPRTTRNCWILAAVPEYTRSSLQGPVTG